MTRRFVASSLAVALLCMAIAVVPGAAQELAPAPKTFDVGFPVEMSGDAAITGDLQRKGTEMALEKINAEGGINGVPMRFIYEDTKGTNPGAISAFNKLLFSHNVIMSFATVRSTMVHALAPIIKENEVPAIFGGSAWSLSELEIPWMFRVRTDDRTVAQIMAKFMVEDLGHKKIAGLHDSDAFGTGGFVETAKALKEMYGIDVLTEQKYSTGTKDYTAQLLAIKNSGATCVFAWGTRLEDDAIILRQKAQLGLEVDFVGSASYSSTPIRDIAGDSVNGIYSAAGFTVANDDPLVQEYVKEFQAKYGELPDENSAWTYSSTLMLADALRKANVIQVVDGKPMMLPIKEAREAIRQALKGVRDFKTPMGSYTCDKWNNMLHEMPIIQIVDRKDKLIKVVSVEPELE